MKRPKVVALIPARMNSSRFPGKPLTMIAGYPMIYWVYKQADKVERIDSIYVVTEDMEIEECCKKYKIPVWLGNKRANTGAEALSFAAKQIEGDIFLNIQGDEPLIEPDAMNQIIDEMLNDKKTYYVGLRSKIKTEDEFFNKNVVKVVTDNQGYALYFSRSPIPHVFQPQICYRVLGIYGYSSDFLKLFSEFEKTDLEKAEGGVEMLRMLENGYRIKLLETECHTIGVDLPEQIPVVEKILKNRIVSN